ncbi:MAG: efflux transporter outer membrane subunit [Muribaculaceae bacterium]|nr:efflux transporter outer membrane subunit [Muribaculaceae bacterium]
MTHHSSLCRVAGLIVLCATALTAQAQEKYLRETPAAAWSEADISDLNFDERTAANTAWWRAFDDPMLDSLIAIGEERNFDLSVAARRIDIARRALQQTQSAYYPQIGISAGWQRERTSGRMAGSHGAASTISYFSAGATMSWEIDVFGKIRQQAKEGKAAVKVSAADYASALIALDAEIASSYINLLVSRAQLHIARVHSESQKHIVDITETRYRTGLVSKLDVAQANTLYYSTIAQIPLLEASIEAAYNSLAVLLGTTKDGLPQGIYAERPLPSHHLLPALGTPLDLLRRRPDVVAAEHSIDQAAAALGVARSAYLPSLSVSASIGTEAHAIGDLFSRQSFAYSVAPTLSWTLFDGFARRAATLEARQQMESAIDSYNLTVITAVEEVRTALSRYTATLKYIDRTENVVENSEEAVRLSLDQYKQGLSDFYNVVEAQLNFLSYQNSLTAARGDALSALIDLYKALGGGYQTD